MNQCHPNGRAGDRRKERREKKRKRAGAGCARAELLYIPRAVTNKITEEAEKQL